MDLFFWTHIPGLGESWGDQGGAGKRCWWEGGRKYSANPAKPAATATDRWRKMDGYFVRKKIRTTGVFKYFSVAYAENRPLVFHIKVDFSEVLHSEQMHQPIRFWVSNGWGGESLHLYPKPPVLFLLKPDEVMKMFITEGWVSFLPSSQGTVKNFS